MHSLHHFETGKPNLFGCFWRCRRRRGAPSQVSPNSKVEMKWKSVHNLGSPAHDIEKNTKIHRQSESDDNLRGSTLSVPQVSRYRANESELGFPHTLL